MGSRYEEFLGLLRAYPPGQIYFIAPKQFVVRGFDYYRRGSLLSFEWIEELSELKAMVRGTRVYCVTIGMNGRGLNFHCNCPAWRPSSHCKHIICALITVKNLLEPEVFNCDNHPGGRDSFPGRLYSGPRLQPPDVQKKERHVSETSGYSIVFRKTALISDFYVRKDGEKLKHFTACPLELRQFVLPAPYYFGDGGFRDLERFIGKYGNKYPFILDTGENECQVRFEEREYTATTEMDANRQSVKIGKIFIEGREDVRDPDMLGNLLFDHKRNSFSIIRNTKGWRLWEESSSLFYKNGLKKEAPDEDEVSYSMPIEMFQTAQLMFPASDGEMPLNVSLKIEGEKAEIVKREPSYRIMISRIPGRNVYTMRAECIIEGTGAPPEFKTFSFLTATRNALGPGLSAHKRRKLLCKAFFKILCSGKRELAEAIMKQELSHQDFRRYSIKRKAKDLLRKHVAFFYQDERQLLLRNMQWISFRCDTAKEALLYKIPYEIFGWEIFKEMPSHDVMLVPGDQIGERLHLLYEHLKAEGIGLFFEHKPVKSDSWEFSFDVSRPGNNIDWFEIRPEIRCDGKFIDETTWQKVLACKGVRDEDDCVRILDANSRKVFAIISGMVTAEKKKHGSRREVVRVPRLRILDWIMLRKSGVNVKLPPEDEKIIARLSAFEELEERPVPENLKCRLRRYQREGYSWLSFLYENRFGACLADDMGLGKTVQAISLLAGVREKLVRYPGRNGESHPHLVVVPPSLLFNWESEIRRFYPDLKVGFYTGKERNTSFDGDEVILTSYGLVRRDIEKLKEIQFDIIVFDEAQAVKNMYADVTGAVRLLNGRFKLTMTGTPIENHIGEYYSLIDLSVPGLLGNYDEFSPLIKKEASETLDRIIRRTRPFVLRRTKEKILKELPPKTETDIYLELTEKQKALYKKTVEQVKLTINNAYSNQTGQQAQIISLTAILKLRQLCVSPKLLSPDIKEPSPKIVFLIERLKELLNGNHSSLVFSQFTSFLDVLGEDLRKNGIDYLRLDGSTQVHKRKKLIETFQEGDSPSVFLLSLKAGGQGLNLTKASYVFHLDPWWNPAVENQASDRAHRIGQKKKVTITRILMKHTIEEKMMALKKRKLELYEAVMEDSGSSKKGFSITKDDFNFLLD